MGAKQFSDALRVPIAEVRDYGQSLRHDKIPKALAEVAGQFPNLRI